MLNETQAWLIANGGYDYTCIDFIQNTVQLPNASDTTSVCAAKVVALDHLQPVGHHVPKSSIVLYGSRTSSSGYDAEHTAQAVAVFMLVRDDFWWFGLPAENSFPANMTATLLEIDYGTPLANMTRTANTFSRAYEHGIVSLDCDTFTATFAPSAHVAAEASR